MTAHFGEDRKRILHALEVLRFVEEIMAGEKITGNTARVATAAAIFHDIAIKVAERKHGSAAGKYQEIEGPPIARDMLQRSGEDPEFIERVCYLIGNHHTFDKIDGPDFQVLWEADLLVNLLAGGGPRDPEALERLIARNFHTGTGRTLAGRMLAGGMIKTDPPRAD